MEKSQSSNITYEAGTIQLTVKKPEGGEPFQLEREAMIAYRDGRSTGLAYLASLDDAHAYSITHLASGLNVCSYWDATSEQEAQAWIAALLRLADWTERAPIIIASTYQMLKYAVVGAIYAEIQKSEEATDGQ